jgi:dynein heavy chain
VFQVDGIGDVKPDYYGSQPGLELLRQYLDYGGWFNPQAVEFQGVVRTSFAATMGVPGGGLFQIPDRLQRHFLLLHLAAHDTKGLVDIVSGLLDRRLSKLPTVRDLFSLFGAAMVGVVNACKAELLPVPSKLH